MPNHITNILEFDCSPERFQQIAESLRSNPEEPLGQVDFNKLIPMPESLCMSCVVMSLASSSLLRIRKPQRRVGKRLSMWKNAR